MHMRRASHHVQGTNLHICAPRATREIHGHPLLRVTSSELNGIQANKRPRDPGSHKDDRQARTLERLDLRLSRAWGDSLYLSDVFKAPSAKERAWILDRTCLPRWPGQKRQQKLVNTEETRRRESEKRTYVGIWVLSTIRETKRVDPPLHLSNRGREERKLAQKTSSVEQEQEYSWWTKCVTHNEMGSKSVPLLSQPLRYSVFNRICKAPGVVPDVEICVIHPKNSTAAVSQGYRHPIDLNDLGALPYMDEANINGLTSLRYLRFLFVYRAMTLEFDGMPLLVHSSVDEIDEIDERLPGAAPARRKVPVPETLRANAYLSKSLYPMFDLNNGELTSIREMKRNGLMNALKWQCIGKATGSLVNKQRRLGEVPEESLRAMLQASLDEQPPSCLYWSTFGIGFLSLLATMECTYNLCFTQIVAIVDGEVSPNRLDRKMSSKTFGLLVSERRQFCQSCASRCCTDAILDPTAFGIRLIVGDIIR
ncbi:hypothetical protein BKA70DRAFT_1232723 [Coprinopsis sp. MPI-PUGE-AT-0042]|nr:hypothetical protein BKA70DRAFT_1232723 [Coprinopsis sp. MPI-PUGE-AT-0042]